MQLIDLFIAAASLIWPTTLLMDVLPKVFLTRLHFWQAIFQCQDVNGRNTFLQPRKINFHDQLSYYPLVCWCLSFVFIGSRGIFRTRGLESNWLNKYSQNSNTSFNIFTGKIKQSFHDDLSDNLQEGCCQGLKYKRPPATSSVNDLRLVFS